MNKLAIVVLSGCVAVILMALFQKNSNFLDIHSIFVDHISVLKRSPLQFCAIMVIPLVIALIGAIYHPLTIDIINNLNIVLSILISMFFAVLSILVSLTRKKGSEDRQLTPEERNYNTLLDETFNSVVFECTLCILLLVISFVQLFFDMFVPSLLLTIASTVVYYLSVVIALNIFVVIKRIKVLFEEA